VRALGLSQQTKKRIGLRSENYSLVRRSVNKAYEYGIINGIGQFVQASGEDYQGTGHVDGQQGHEHYRTETAEESSAADTGNVLAAYSDTDRISKYAKSGVAACMESEVVNGKGVGRIAPKENITRAEVSVIIKRLLEKSDLI